MQIEGSASDKRSERTCFTLALEPPGNVARDLAAFRRSLFAVTGRSSYIFLPEIAPLAFVRRSPSFRASVSDLRRSVDEMWNGVEGNFSSGSVVASRGILYLEFSGPLKALSARIREAAKVLEPCLSRRAPFEAGKGFFLGQALEPVSFPDPPRLSFRDCSLLLLRLDFSEEDFEAVSWREIARAKRRTGPSDIPSRRERR